MIKIEKIAIIGAGAMEAAHAAMFSEAGNFSVSFVALGQRYKRLKEGSLTVDGKQVAVPVIHPDEVTEPARLVLVALKHHHLHGALQDIEAGRKTEVDIFGGKVVAMGAKYQVMTPVNETILRIIKVIESN